MTDIDSIIDRIKAGETGQKITADTICAVLAPNGAYVEQSPLNGRWCIYEPKESGDARASSWHLDKELKPALYDKDLTTSIDACRALHERVLPGWIGNVTTTGQAWVMSDQEQLYGVADTPAAALLIAILKAVKAESEAA